MSPFATYIKAVDVLTDKGWRTFESIKDAANYIGCAHSTLPAKLIRDLPCKGYQVRYHEQTQTIIQ